MAWKMPDRPGSKTLLYFYSYRMWGSGCLCFQAPKPKNLTLKNSCGYFIWGKKRDNAGSYEAALSPALDHPSGPFQSLD